MKINHHITFTGPAFVPTSTDETSARETTGATVADVGVDPYGVNVKDIVTDLDINSIEDAI